MLKKLINNQRFITNLSIIVCIFIGIGLVYSMEYYTGFRWSAILGMLATILFQVSLFKLFCCRKEWRLFAWSSGWLIYSAIVYRTIVATCRMNLFWKLQDSGYMVGLGYLRVWNHIEDGIYLLIGIMFFVGLYKWLLECGNKKGIINKISAILFALAGVALLLLRSFTNAWYIVLCVVTSVITWFVLGHYEKVWHSKGMDNSVAKEKGLFDIVLDYICDECLDEDYEEDEFSDDLSMSEFTLDMLIDFSKQLDKEPFDDYTKYRYMVMMINRLRDNYGREDKEEKEKDSSYLAKIISLDKYKEKNM